MAAQLANFVLIPSRPMFFDLHAILSTYEIARLSKTPAAVVLNGVPPRGSFADEAREALQGQCIPVVEPVMHHRAAYFNALFDGRSVQEYDPKGKAAEEIESLYITTWKVIGYGIDPLKNISLLNQLVTKKTLKDSSANFFRTFNGLRLTFQVVFISLYPRP
jgi:cellulose biosynthesis protein BcsQ